jgi:hypothetical protein
MNGPPYGQHPQLYSAPTAHVEPEGHRCLWEDCDKIATDPEVLYTHLCNEYVRNLSPPPDTARKSEGKRVRADK